MTDDEHQANLNIGLAEEEREELEQLIGTFKDERFAAPQSMSLEEVQAQIAFLKEKMTGLSVMLLDIDKKMRSLYEVITLFYKKTEVMNERINDAVALLKSGKHR
jgi:hypothetical protein